MKALAQPTKAGLLPMRSRRINRTIRCSCKETKSIARLAEVTAGRLAFGGLLGTSIIGNLTGTSMFQQYNAGCPYVWAFISAVVLGTIASNPGGICEDKAANELQAGRSSMVVVFLLGVFDVLFVHS